MSTVKSDLIRRFIRQTRMIRAPKKLLSTFGATRVEYHLVSPVDDLPNKSRLREGFVEAQRPQILTPDALQERFEDFGEDSSKFSQYLDMEFQDLLRALEYKFFNKGFKSRVITQEPHAAACNIRDDLDRRDVARSAVIECPDAGWTLALMRFTLEEAARSFGTNVRDLDQHGLFNPGSNTARARENEIERLFGEASGSESARQLLGSKLREYDLFEDYEDRFLALYK
jgi:hypothetical protein